MEWVVQGVLARDKRPGYQKIDGRKTVDRDAVDPWLHEVKTGGICGVLCLLEESELDLYNWLSRGLLEWYRDNDLHVEHVPIPDYQSPEPVTSDQLNAALAAFERSPKPVLVHCSYGQGRTGPVVSHLSRNS